MFPANGLTKDALGFPVLAVHLSSAAPFHTFASKFRRKMMPDVRITRNNHLDRNTPQSAGILRLAAINSDLSSSSHICCGIMIAQPHSASFVDDHGEPAI